MKNKLSGAAALLALCMLAGCDFSSDKGCAYYGTLKASVDWSHLKAGQAGATDMNIVYYPLEGEATGGMTGVSERFETNPLVRNLNTGLYRFLFFNRATNPTRGLESAPEEGEIYSDLTAYGGRTFIATRQQFVYSLLSNTREIRTDDTTRVMCNARCLVQNLIFNFNLRGMAEAFRVDSVSAVLDGVTTSRRLYDGERGTGYASLSFAAERANEEKAYTASVLVFGINNTAGNTVHITVDFENGRRGEADADLGEALRDFTADRKVIDVDVEILGNLSLEAAIASWVDRDWGDIPLLMK
jgi:hypothetical protein